jgi:hypothetical protein
MVWKRPLSTPRARHTATLLHDGPVLLTGGTDGVEPLASFEVHDPTTQTFSLAPSALMVPRQDHTATLLPDGRVLVAGGSDSSGALNWTSSHPFTEVAPRTICVQGVTEGAMRNCPAGSTSRVTPNPCP